MFYVSVPYVRNNAQYLSFSAILILINVGLIVGRLYEYSTFKNADGSLNWCVMIARATGKSQMHARGRVSEIPKNMHIYLRMVHSKFFSIRNIKLYFI